jgi:hypothetical protein
LEYKYLSLGKGLDFHSTYSQMVREVRVESDRILIIPEFAPEGWGGPQGSFCAKVRLSPDEFSRLRSVEFIGGARVPSAGRGRGFAGKLGIGSDGIEIEADFPDPSPGGDRYRVRALTSLSSVKPAKHSGLTLGLDLARNGNFVDTKNAMVQLESQKYHYVRFSMHLENSELHTELTSTLSQQEIADSVYVDPAVTSYAVVKSNVRIPTDAPRIPPHERIGGLKVCWRPNNTNSVTTKPAELINPRVTLILESP